jgi:oligopeptide transport system substrate-binding protein
VNRKPLDNKNLRKALSLAINRDELTKHVTKGGQIPAGCFTPYNTAGYSFDTVLSFNPSEAKRLLAEAGFDNKNPVPALSLLYNTSESHHTIAQAIQQMWKEHLGIEVTLINQEWKVYLSSTNTKDYEIARMDGSVIIMIPTRFLIYG